MILIGDGGTRRQPKTAMKSVCVCVCVCVHGVARSALCSGDQTKGTTFIKRFIIFV